MSEGEIREKLEYLIDEVVGSIIPDLSGLSPSEKLAILPGESLQSLIFVSSVEDEFDILFEDEEIDRDFFQDIDVIIDRIDRHLQQSSGDVTGAAVLN
jgi:acyl carrier protein